MDEKFKFVNNTPLALWMGLKIGKYDKVKIPRYQFQAESKAKVSISNKEECRYEKNLKSKEKPFFKSSTAVIMMSNNLNLNIGILPYRFCVTLLKFIVYIIIALNSSVNIQNSISSALLTSQNTNAVLSVATQHLNWIYVFTFGSLIVEFISMLFSFSSLSTLQNLSALAFHSLGLFLVTFYAFDGWSYNGLLTIFLITGLPPVLIEIILISKEICHKRYKATSEASVYSNHIQKCCTPGCCIGCNNCCKTKLHDE